MIATWPGDATFGRIFVGIFNNPQCEAVFSHIFKFLKKCYQQIGGYLEVVSIYGVISSISPIKKHIPGFRVLEDW